MKKFILLIVTMLCVFPSLAQVGINTTHPTATLDINGSIRVREMFTSEAQAVKLLGVDSQGNLIQLRADENVYIEGDQVKATIVKEEIHIYPTIIVEQLHDAPGIIWPGGTGNTKSYVRVESTWEDLELTGIDISAFATPLDAHGYTVSLYSVTGFIDLIHEDVLSTDVNRLRLRDNQDMLVKQYETVKLMYDGYLERWLVVSKH